MKVYVVIDEGCQECGLTSEPVGIYRTQVEAEAAARARNEMTKGWRDYGQTTAFWYEFDLGAVLPDGARAGQGEGFTIMQDHPTEARPLQPVRHGQGEG
jgi:hypothetical protein